MPVCPTKGWIQQEKESRHLRGFKVEKRGFRISPPDEFDPQCGTARMPRSFNFWNPRFGKKRSLFAKEREATDALALPHCLAVKSECADGGRAGWPGAEDREPRRHYRLSSKRARLRRVRKKRARRRRLRARQPKRALDRTVLPAMSWNVRERPRS